MKPSLTSVFLGLQILRINLDETSIPCFKCNVRGNVFPDGQRGTKQVHRHVASGRKHKFLTLIALVADRQHVQAFLPQIVIGNKHAFRAKDMDSLRAAGTDLVLIRLALSSFCACRRLMVLSGSRAHGTMRICLRRCCSGLPRLCVRFKRSSK